MTEIKAKPTPGPWDIRSRQDGSKSITGAYRYEPGHSPYWTGGILLVCDIADDKHHGEANARLIAAAPDMLAAAEPIASLVKHYSGPDDSEIAVSAGELRALAAAIAKASA